MNLSTRRQDTDLHITIKGNIKHSDIRKLRNTLQGFEEYLNVYLDLSEIDLVDSSFINFLLGIKKEHPKTCQRIQLLNPRDFVRSAFSMFKIDQYFQVTQRPVFKTAAGSDTAGAPALRQRIARYNAG
jgi:anti-anti-sigma factor